MAGKSDLLDTMSVDDTRKCLAETINNANAIWDGYTDVRCFAAMLLQELRSINANGYTVGLMPYYELRADALGLE